MFATYTTLFIGYSHGDVVMRYLARALGSRSQRYVLTPQPQSPDWRGLRLRPIGYDVVHHSHAALVEGVAGWAKQASMGLLDHRQQVRRLTLGSPPQIPEQVSYLEAVVADAARVRLFTEFARGEEWLTWAAEQPPFRQLFDRNAAAAETDRELAFWFTKHFVMCEELTPAALRTVRKADGALGAALWSTLGQQLHARNEPRPAWLGPWITLLVEMAPQRTEDWLDYALVASRWPEDRAAALLLLDFLTEPLGTIERSVGLGGSVRFDITARGSTYWLAEAWQKLFLPHLAEAARDVVVIVERHLHRAHRLLTIAGSAHPGWDPLSFQRSAIEPHEQDAFRNPVALLIDAARDSIESLVDRDDATLHATLERWADSDVPLLQRLAVHGTARRATSATSKIAWLRDRGWLFDVQLHHEVFRLIAVALPEADPTVADALVADALVGPSSLDPEPRVREIHRLLAWSVEHAPELVSARDALGQINDKHPHLPTSPRPDLLAWMDVGWVGPQPPTTTAELHAGLQQDARQALEELRGCQTVTYPFEGPTWGDALSVLRATVREHPEDGFAVLDVATQVEVDVVQVVVDGWAGAALDDDTARAVLVRLAALDLTAVGGAVARLLSSSTDEQQRHTAWHELDAARTLAAELWTRLPGDEAPTVEAADALTQAINHPGGDLAQFWIHAIAADWRAADASWTALDAAARAALEQMLAGTDTRAAMAQVVLASQLSFLHSADQDWTRENVLPLLDWSDPERAARAWDGFLGWGRPSDRLFADGLDRAYLDTAARASALRDETRRHLATHLANLAVYSEHDLREWTAKLSAAAEVRDRVDWMDQIAWLLRDLTPEAAEGLWQRWIESYWRARLEGVPNMLTVQEVSAMAPWVLSLLKSLPAAVDLITQHDAGLVHHGDLLRNLDEATLARAPAALVKLVAHLLRGTPAGQFWHCDDLRRIVQVAGSYAADDDVRVFVEQATRLGCLQAATW